MTREETRLWMIAGGASILAFLLIGRHTDEDDTDALTRMLLAETDFASTSNEMAQIVYVALNRAKKWGTTPANVVTPPGRPGVWNTGSVYSQRFYAASGSSKWAAARAFVQQVQAGAYANVGATSFVHPGGMPTPPCSDTRVSTSTIAGQRCLPQWAVGGQVVGKAMFV